jgi:hypothetical protein
LWVTPSRSTPRGAITGTKPASATAAIGDGSTRETQGPAAALLDQRHDLPVHLAAEDHLHHFHRLVVGDAQAVDEGRHLAQAIEDAADLGPAAVDDHRSQTDVLEQYHVDGE